MGILFFGGIWVVLSLLSFLDQRVKEFCQKN